MDYIRQDVDLVSSSDDSNIRIQAEYKNGKWITSDYPLTGSDTIKSGGSRVERGSGPNSRSRNWSNGSQCLRADNDPGEELRQDVTGAEGPGVDEDGDADMSNVAGSDSLIDPQSK